MPVSEEIRTIRPEGEMRVCPHCGYEYGFRVSLADVSPAAGPIKIKTTNRVFKVILVCPFCGTRFDVGWRMTPVEVPVQIHEAEGHKGLHPFRLPEPGRNTD
jgi:uncharacterized Zn-finger protein